MKPFYMYNLFDLMFTSVIFKLWIVTLVTRTLEIKNTVIRRLSKFKKEDFHLLIPLCIGES